MSSNLGTSARVVLSFGCVLLATGLFNLRGISSYRLDIGIRFDFFVLTLLFALPGWLLCLPLVIAFKDAESWRGWVILIVGVSIGPGFILAWRLLTMPNGGHFTRQGDGYSLLASTIVSFLTTIFYVLTLKIIHRRSASSEHA
jgi:hypothetical protein